ncbi:hypothetical protein SNE510_45120 [Streptomyces sp. NE5-10]|nr:hypothetical protein SNE510_45120 [Streptomyces sp. NE5-10]
MDSTLSGTPPRALDQQKPESRTRPPEPCAQVRILPGALREKCHTDPVISGNAESGVLLYVRACGGGGMGDPAPTRNEPGADGSRSGGRPCEVSGAGRRRPPDGSGGQGAEPGGYLTFTAFQAALTALYSGEVAP